MCRPVGPAGESFGCLPQQQQFRRTQCLLTCLLTISVLLHCCIYLALYIPLAPFMAAFMRNHEGPCFDPHAWNLCPLCVFCVQVREGQLATVEGVSYLEAKYLLLLHYCIHLVFYVLLKAEGRSVRDHPVISRLVEIRAFLEKARPIDKRLRYQMDKLLAAAALVQVSQLCCSAAAHD